MLILFGFLFESLVLSAPASVTTERHSVSFDACLRELVLTLDYFIPVVLESIHSSIASTVAANPERDDRNIGHYALCHWRLR